nr:uncharacterized protein LOC110002059 [Labrus bergylta]
MENFYKHTGIRKTFSLIFYMVWISSQAEGKLVFAEAGRSVNLPCNNKSIGRPTQLTWMMNETQLLFSFIPKQQFHMTPEAQILNMNMSDSESKLYGLIIERAQTSHTGNYTCMTTTPTGVWEQKWELIITDPVEVKHWNKLAMAATVPCVCGLIFIIALIIMLKVCRKGSDTCVHSLPADMHEQTEDIYENCFESRSKTRAN